MSESAHPFRSGDRVRIVAPQAAWNGQIGAVTGVSVVRLVARDLTIHYVEIPGWGLDGEPLTATHTADELAPEEDQP
jgi:hypothetical protein